jgi:hypothetical protein
MATTFNMHSPTVQMRKCSGLPHLGIACKTMIPIIGGKKRCAECADILYDDRSSRAGRKGQTLPPQRQA